jgi:uncharacterized membrane protein YhaH (DUF805 family)
MDLIFNLEGRARRLEYWAISLTVGLPLTVIRIALSIFAHLPHLFEAQYLVTAVLVLAVNVRRLHDRNKRGWWLAVYWIAPFLPLAILSAMAARNPEGQMPIWLVIALIGSAVLSVWAFIDLGCLPGTQGENRFGPDPKSEPEPEPQAAI